MVEEKNILPSLQVVYYLIGAESLVNSMSHCKRNEVQQLGFKVYSGITFHCSILERSMLMFFEYLMVILTTAWLWMRYKLCRGVKWVGWPSSDR